MTTTDAPAWKVFEARGLKPRGENFDTNCPAHKDERKSLSLSIGEGGKIIMRCFAGCPPVTIVEAIGLKMQDLWPPKESQPTFVQPRIKCTYDYIDENGELLYQVVRMDPKGFRQRRPSTRGESGWEWSLPQTVRRVLYRLPELLASGDRIVLLVEGEKDVDNLRALGFIATTCCGGASSWRPEYAESLKGRQVAIIPDNDAAGMQLAADASTWLPGALVVRLSETLKDASDWIESGGTAGELRAIVLDCARQRLEQTQKLVARLEGKK